jgi:hypothetical protein
MMDEYPCEGSLHPGIDKRGSAWLDVIDSPADWVTSLSEDYEGIAWVKLSTKLRSLTITMHSQSD